MDKIPPYHVCNALTAENESLKEKHNKLKRKYKELYKEMLELKENLTRMEIEKQYTELSTKPSLQHRLKDNRSNTVIRETQVKQEKSAQKMLPLYNSLMKRYEMETKINRNQSKKIRKLESVLEKLQDDMFKSCQENEFLKKQILNKETMLQSASSTNKTNRTVKQECENRISVLIKEKTKLSRENQEFRDELKGFDKSFFEELEDMKYALQQSTKLNDEYEHALRRLCKQTGLSYEKALQHQHSTPSSRKKKKKKTRRQSNTSLHSL